MIAISGDKLVSSKPPEKREIVKELARFADLWRHFRERNEKLGREKRYCPHAQTASGVACCTGSEINQELMDRVGDPGTGSRQ